MTNTLRQTLSGVFGAERFDLRSITRFSDQSIQAVFESADVKLENTDQVAVRLKTAEDARGSADRVARIKAACIYLNFAQGEIRPSDLTKAECYHRAANELRGLDILERAAECYFYSAVCALEATPVVRPSDDKHFSNIDEAIKLGLRSSGRAKAQYSALGVDDKADDAHRLKQEILRRKYTLDGHWIRFVLFTWKAMTGYGTSVDRWFGWLLVILASFAVLYGVCYYFQLLALANNAPLTIVTPIYLAVVNLVGFGAYTQIVPMSWIAEIVLVLQAISSFVIVGTGVTFLTTK